MPLDVNEAEHGSGATGLMLASIIGHVELIKFLIDQGLNRECFAKIRIYFLLKLSKYLKKNEISFLYRLINFFWKS